MPAPIDWAGFGPSNLTFTASLAGAYTVQKSAYHYISLCGGGGGGGAGNATAVTGGGGGGGGAGICIIRYPVFLSVGQILDVTIGAGGGPGSAGSPTIIQISSVTLIGVLGGNAGSAGGAAIGGAGGSVGSVTSAAAYIAGAAAAANGLFRTSWAAPFMYVGTASSGSGGGTNGSAAGGGYIPVTDTYANSSGVNGGGMGGMNQISYGDQTIAGLGGAITANGSTPNAVSYGSGGGGGGGTAASTGGSGASGIIIIQDS